MSSSAEPLGNTATVAYCRTCGKQVFGATPQQIAQGLVFCDQHAPVNASPYTSPDSPWTASSSTGIDGPSPGLAFLLGFLVPGVGAVYNGQYAKGLVHAIITGLLISILSSGAAAGMEPLIALLLCAWIFYMAFEAYHTARKRRLGEVPDEFSSILPMQAGQNSSLVGPVILIGLGVIFLLNNLGVLQFYLVLKYWPLFFIALGAYLLYARLRPEVPRGE